MSQVTHQHILSIEQQQSESDKGVVCSVYRNNCLKMMNDTSGNIIEQTFKDTGSTPMHRYTQSDLFILTFSSKFKPTSDPAETP
jgi:hypothetical protein